MVYENDDFNLPQLDGQTDFLNDVYHKNPRSKNEKIQSGHTIGKNDVRYSKSTQNMNVSNKSQYFDTFKTNCNQKSKISNKQSIKNHGKQSKNNTKPSVNTRTNDENLYVRKFIRIYN